jgi:hypothetical protein
MLKDRRETSPTGAAVEGAESAEEIQELRNRVEALQRELGCLKDRLELTERTESTMRVERERLEEAQRPWWQKLFSR